MKYFLSFLFFSFLVFVGCKDNSSSEPNGEEMQIVALRIGAIDIVGGTSNMAPNNMPLVVSFSKSLNLSTVPDNIHLFDSQDNEVDLLFSYLDQNKTVSAKPTEQLNSNASYSVEISNDIRGEEKETFAGYSTTFRTLNPPLEVLSAHVDDVEVDGNKKILDVEFQPEILIKFSEPISAEALNEKVYFLSSGQTVFPSVTKQSDSIFSFSVNEELNGYEKYTFNISRTVSYEEKDFEGFEFDFYTELDSTLKFPEITDEELLTKVQEQTFKYFWDFAHSTSGLARERNTSNNLVTIGGSGFGVMSILVGIERGFITRAQGVDRLETIVDFLAQSDRFHGVWPHWMDGTTGDVIPFSSKDDGGDLVETAFMIQGLLTVREYLSNGTPTTQEQDIIDAITTLWEEVEWDWYQQNGQDVLYWHWSPNFGWEMNHKIAGWNEALIVYVLAASSPTHSIDIDVYKNGWASNGGMVNTGNNFYGYTLPLRNDMGGPLFFAHYSFLGLDPRNLSDQYANYWDQNVYHSLVNQAYCEDNPSNFVGYKKYCWGLTASDNHEGYSAHSPNNDKGVITPTAALSSFPYTPDESMNALKHFYYILGDKLWGQYGFYDAFNITEGWYASSYLAIDQGPIILMIENHRTQLLWNNFMGSSEIQSGLTKLGFTYE